MPEMINEENAVAENRMRGSLDADNRPSLLLLTLASCLCIAGVDAAASEAESQILCNNEAVTRLAQLDVDQIHRLILLVDTFDADVTPAGTGLVAVDDIGIVVPARPEGGE